MSVRRGKSRSLHAAISVVAAAFLFTACASTPSEDEQAASNAENPSDAALLLDDSSQPVATEVSDAGAFADLEAGNEKPAATEVEPGAATTTADEGTPYYNSIGGESLRRVAHTLYSDKGWASKLLDKNPELKGIKKLAAEQKVYFDMDAARPEPTYLTKDLLDRYADQLAQRLTASVDEKGITKTTVTLNPGETLQELSKRLYGTHRYWTEIFLVNHDKIQNYDRVKSGTTLTVYERGTTVAAASTQPAAPAVDMTPPPPVQESAPEPVVEAQPVPIEPEPVAMPTQPAPVEATQPMPTPAPMDPIPETPPAPVAAVQPMPEPVTETPPTPLPEVAPTTSATAEISSSNAVTRPIIYAVLVLLILGGGFYYTRQPKKPKVDMLDITSAESAGRPKLATKDSQKHQIG